MSHQWELVEEKQPDGFTRLYVRLGPGQYGGTIYVATGTAAVPLSGEERRLGRQVEQSQEMLQITMMVAAFGGQHGDAEKQAMLLGGAWRQAVEDGGRSALYNLLTYKANRVLDRIRAGGD